MYGAQKGHMGPIEEMEAISELASSLAALFPEDWKSAVYDASFIGAYGSGEIDIERASGDVVRVSLPASIMVNVMHLRAGMYKENEGTWFSWELALFQEEGRFRSKFNYEDAPLFVFEPDIREYRREIKIFPRSENFTPRWLREKIDEGTEN